jgi:hypothetical protein
MPITEARKRMNENFMRLIKHGLTDCLRDHGFKRKDMTHWRDLDSGVTYVVLPFRPKETQPPDGTSFYIDCSIGVHASQELYPEHLRPRHTYNAQQLQFRPGDVTNHKFGDHWLISADITKDQLQLEVTNLRRLFADHVIPWFERFQNPKDVGDYLASPEEGPGRRPVSYREIPQQALSLRNAAIAYFGAGEIDRAREMISLAEKTIDRHGRHLTTILRERIEQLVAQRQLNHAKQ